MEGSLSPRQREILNEYGEASSGTAVVERPDSGEEDRLGEWWALRLEERKSCGDCGFSWPFYWENVQIQLERRRVQKHLVIVWPSAEDPALLDLLEREPGEVVLYEPAFGEAESWYAVNPS